MPKVFIGSTQLDLKAYRDMAIYVCQRLGHPPVAMESFGPDTRAPLETCLAKVDEADFYLGIFAHRYGWVPDGRGVSITELEYDRAIARGLPVHLYVVDPDHAWLPKWIDEGDAKARLQQFKDRIGRQHTLRRFRDVDAFKEDLLVYLPDALRAQPSTPPASGQRRGGVIPAPPALHAVPPYVGGQRFIGRREELDELEQWAGSDDTVLVVDAIGGAGKSALTWEWTRTRAREVRPDLAGTFWWSFYEGAATTGSWAREALAYVTRQEREAVAKLDRADVVQALLDELRARPWLMVLDGFERVLNAYHRFDPSKLRDDQVDARLRACTAPADVDLLRRLVGCGPSKVLMSTRLMPAALENNAHQPLPGVCHKRLAGLTSDDALALMRAQGLRGSAAAMRAFVEAIECHPLLLGVVCGLVRDYRLAPCDFDRWRADPQAGGDLHLSRLELTERRTHILGHALAGVEPKVRLLLGRIAVFSEAVGFDTLSVLNPYLPPAPEEVQEPHEPDVGGEVRRRLRSERFDSDAAREARAREIEARVRAGYAQERERYETYRRALQAQRESPEYRTAIPALVSALDELEARGLLAWDRDSNLYDLHPVVRGYAYDTLEGGERVAAFERIRDHFERLPPEDADEATELSDLKQTLTILRALIGAGHFDEAVRLYGGSVADALVFSIGSYATAVELLAPLVGRQPEGPTVVTAPRDASYVIGNFATALWSLGRVEEAVPWQRRMLRLDLAEHDWISLATGLSNHALSLELLNRLAAAARVRQLSYELSDVADAADALTQCCLHIAWTHLNAGQFDAAEQWLARFEARPTPPRATYRPGDAEVLRCRLAFHRGSLTARALHDALNVATSAKNPIGAGDIRALQAEWALQAGRLDTAFDAAEQALAIARKTGGSSLAAREARVARILARQGDADGARVHLERALEMSRELAIGDRPYCQAAETCLDLGDHAPARQWALEAYKQAWADGPPHVWWWELERAKKVLAGLGAPEPQLPPFDPTRVEPIPYEAEILRVIEELRAQKARQAAKQPKPDPTGPSDPTLRDA